MHPSSSVLADRANFHSLGTSKTPETAVMLITDLSGGSRSLMTFQSSIDELDAAT